MKVFGSIIYSHETVSGEAVSKVKSHTPKIEIPEEIKANEIFEIKINVGPHPNTIQHSIRWIEVYYYEEDRAYNPIYLATVRLEPEYAKPTITLRAKLRKSGTLYVLAYCNIHGLWEGRKEIRVKT